MNTRLISTFLLSSVVLLASAVGETTAPVAKSDAVSQAKAKGRPVLEKGMTAEAIIALIGKPSEVTPMNAPEGKAEKWIYNRITNTRTVPTGSTQSVPTFIGVGGNGAPMIGSTLTQGSEVKFVITTQVTSLLMFEGKLAVAKQWLEQTESYQ